MKKIGIAITYPFGATVNRIASIINVLNDYEIHLVGPLDNTYLTNFNTNNALEIHVIPADKKTSNNYFRRYFFEFIYSIKCSRKLKSLSCDIELISIPFISLAITSSLYKSTATQIVDIRDLVWEYLSRKTIFDKIIYNLVKYIHLRALKNYKFITVTNKNEFHKLESDLPKIKKEIISNGISKYKFDQIQQTIQSVNSDSDKIRITYIGNVGIAQDLWSFIRIIKNYENIELIIVGDGNDYNNLLNRINKYKIINVKFIGRVPENDVIKYYSETDYLWAKLDPRYSTAIPSKLYEYLSTGKPIIYSGRGAAVQFLHQFENIFLLNNDDDLKSFCNDVFKSNKELNSFMNIQKIKNSYIRENINHAFLTIIKNITNEK